ncbi:NLI interacting domain protein [Stenotrophomonas maltophilia]|nr:NLI interacting domain protein [Stenotrophomonas maltophilia]
MDLNDRKLLVLDLDETLVFSTERPLDRPADLNVVGYHVYKRPHLDEFLEFAFSRFRVGVWTSSGGLYAEPLVAQLMPNRRLEFVWSSRRCSLVRNWEEGGYSNQKRLAKLKKHGFKLKQIIGVDDTASKYARNYGNLVQAQEFTGDPSDDELLYLIQYLEVLDHETDIRTVEKRGWRARLREHQN